MIQSFLDWLFEPAKWWQFWMPQSGFLGGCIMGLYIALFLALIY